MKVLITGGLGFIGSNLTKLLLSKKSVKKIIIIDNFSKSSTKYLDLFAKYKIYKSKNKYKKSNARVEVIKADIMDYKFALKVTKNIDYVVHLAAESGVDASINEPKKAFDINVIGTFNYLDAARVNNIKRFIFSSSGAVFGNAKPPISEDMPRSPISPYGSSKLSIESFCETYSSVFSINSTILRFSNAYGNYSNHKTSVVSTFINRLINRQSLVINGNGEHTRDFIHVEDICSAMFKCLRNKVGSETFHVATGNETSLNSLIRIFKESLNDEYQKNIKVIYKNPRLGDMKKNYSSIAKIKKELKWKPKYNLKDGLKSTISWYMGEKN